jgi:hypothetical protein
VTKIEGVVAPFDQTLLAGLLLASVTLPPGQNCVGPSGVITGAGGVCVTVTLMTFEVSDWQVPPSARTQ